MFRLILGESGTGKTAEIFRRAMEGAKRGERALLLVPEQFSFQAEKTVYTALFGEDALAISVLSFSRLSENIFRACGGLAQKRLTDTAKLVLMKLAVREMQDTLTVYQRQKDRSSFLNTMLQTVEELKQSGTYPGDLEEVALGVREEQLSQKLRDIAGIYGAYQALVDRGYSDPLDDIAKAARLGEESRYFEGASVYIDGFSFFSPPQRRMLCAMMEQGKDVTLSLCTDNLSVREGIDIFTDQKKTAHRLLAYAKEHFIPVASPVTLTENRRTSSPALLEAQRLARGEEEGEDAFEDGEGVRLILARDRFEEVRFAAAKIAGLVREGRRYRDFALVSRNLEDYATPIRSIFTAYGIPVFLETKEPVLSQPIVSFALAALAGAGGNFPTEAVLKVARSPAMALSVEEAASLENYAYVWSVRGEEWLREFRNNPQGLREEPPERYAEALETAETVRKKVIFPLQKLREELVQGGAKHFVGGLFAFFEGAGALENLKKYFEGDPEQGLERGRLNDRLWNAIVDILDLFTDHLGEARYSHRELTELFSMALGSAELETIPVTNDQVLAGSADTVRLDSPLGVFVLGVNEGVFPAAASPYGVFTAREREVLIQNGVEIASPDLERTLLERFYLYSALSAPRESLYLSCARADLTGSAMEPALLFSRLRERFSGSVMRPEELSPYCYIQNAATAKSAYASLLADGREEAAAVEDLLAQLGEEEYLGSVAALRRDLPAGDISPKTAKSLIGDRITLSPTKIETYYRCPFSFFCQSLLGLTPRKRVEYSPLESGTAIHYVMEMLLKELSGKGVGDLSDQELTSAVRRLLLEYLRLVAVDTQQLTSRLKYQFERLVSVLFLLVRQVGEEFGQSAFVAAGMEVPVGENGVIHPTPLVAKDGTPVLLRGKIDRVDTFRDETGSYARVVDYKSGGKEFRLEEVLYGLNMQMLVYLFALCDDQNSPFGPVEPAGILYMPGNISAVKTAPGASSQEVREEVAKRLQMSGVVLDEENVLRAMEQDLEGRFIPVRKKKDDTFTLSSKVQSRSDFQKLRDLVYENIRQMADDLTQGRVSPLPARSGRLNPCDTCDYGKLCNNCNKALCRSMEGKKEQKGGGES